MLILILSCSTGGLQTAGTIPDPTTGGDSSAPEAKGDTSTTETDSDCCFDPGDGWTIAASATSLDVAHHGVVDLTVSDFGTRIGSGPIDPGVVGGSNLYVEGRMGVETTYWMKQPYGAGATVSIGTANDHFAFYAENESGDNNDVESVAVYAASVTPRSSPRVNVAAWFSAANAPAGNIGTRIDAQYSPDASPPNQTLQLREMSGDTPLYVGYYNPNYIDARDGAYAVAGFDMRINGAPVATFTNSGVYAESFQVWSSQSVKSDIVPLSSADRAAAARDVLGMQVVRFRYTGDTTTHVGLIAEDTPIELVDAERRAVRLPETVAYLVASNQELSAQNTELRAELRQLRADVELIKRSGR